MAIETSAAKAGAKQGPANVEMKCGNCEHFDDASGGKCAVWAKGIPADARAVMPEWAIDELSVCSGDAFSWRGSDCSLFERRQGFMKLHRQVQP